MIRMKRSTASLAGKMLSGSWSIASGLAASAKNGRELMNGERADASTALHKRFGHDPAKWASFQACYRKELAEAERIESLKALAGRARHTTITHGSQGIRRGTSVRKRMSGGARWRRLR
jgi:hypothetical protein